MTSSPLDLPAARRYLEAADQFSALVRSATQKALGKFLRELEEALANLYGAGASLPEIEPDTATVPESGLPQDRNLALQGSLGRLLGRFDSYREIFHPSDPEDKEPVQYLLSLELIEILEDQEYARSLVDPSRAVTPNDVVWQWRCDFTTHWGRHAASALRVINNLLYTEFVEALEEGGADA